MFIELCQAKQPLGFQTFGRWHPFGTSGQLSGPPRETQSVVQFDNLWLWSTSTIDYQNIPWPLQRCSLLASGLVLIRSVEKHNVWRKIEWNFFQNVSPSSSKAVRLSRKYQVHCPQSAKVVLAKRLHTTCDIPARNWKNTIQVTSPFVKADKMPNIVVWPILTAKINHSHRQPQSEKATKILPTPSV